MNGTLYYKDGAVRFVGEYIINQDGQKSYIRGQVYFHSGILWMEGEFQRGGLRKGNEYYPSGQLMFSGEYNDRETGSYYGPPYPLCGKFYTEDGTLVYNGKVQRVSHGSLGYPYIRLPNGDMPVKGIDDRHYRE